MKFSKTTSFASWGIAAAITLACGGAFAQTANISLTTGANKLATNFVNDFNNGVAYASSSTGALSLSANGGTSFWAYCIDPKTGTQFGVANTYAVASLNSFLNTLLTNTSPSSTGYQQQMNASGYTGLAYSIQSASLVEASLTNLFSHAFGDSLTTNNKSAAFGYAVWEIMGQPAYSRTAGALRSTGTTAAADGDALEVQIDAYLTALTSNSWSSVNGANLTATTNYTYSVYFDPTSHTSQNFITATASGGSSVPEPATLALLGVALIGGLTTTRRRALRR